MSHLVQHRGVVLIVIGYGWDNRHHRPALDLVSLYADQQPESDLSRARAREFGGMKIYPSIAEALTLCSYSSTALRQA